MPAKKPAPKAAQKRAAKAKPAAPPPAQRQTVLDRSDMHRILFDLAHQVAPADLETLMENEDALRDRVRAITDPNLLLFRKQLALAVECVRDHVDGDCPQIPYYTISLIGAALLYFTDEFDVIPDFLPDVGHLDDAVVMAMACELGADGLQRYCDFKEINAEGVLPMRRANRL